jgi:hypothetical protein
MHAVDVAARVGEEVCFVSVSVSVIAVLGWVVDCPLLIFLRQNHHHDLLCLFFPARTGERVGCRESQVEECAMREGDGGAVSFLFFYECRCFVWGVTMLMRFAGRRDEGMFERESISLPPFGMRCFSMSRWGLADGDQNGDGKEGESGKRYVI